MKKGEDETGIERNMSFQNLTRRRLLHDFGVVPALYDDYGHYLFSPQSLEEQIVGDGGWNVGRYENLSLTTNPIVDADKNWKTQLATRTDLRNVVLVDKKLCFASFIDFLVWEGEKYRIYISEERLRAYCPISVLVHYKKTLGRMALASVRKTRLSNLVHDDYAVVGKNIVFRATPMERRKDVRMIHRIHAILEGKSFLSASQSSSLYPNQKADYSSTLFQLPDSLQKHKMEISSQVRDVSVVWQFGHFRRERIRALNIYRWDDPFFLNVLEKIVPPVYAGTIRQMVELAMDTSGKRCIVPERNVLPEELFVRDMRDWVFVDFETDFQKCIYMVGYSTIDDGYQSEWASAIHPVSEKPLIHRVYSTLQNLKQQGKRLCYFYAEDLFWKERCFFHQLPEYRDLFQDGLDLHKVMTHFLFRNVFTFKLKHIAKALHEMGEVQSTLPEGCDNGADSVHLATEYFKTGSETLRDVLTRYNAFDCQILMEILAWVRSIYT